MRRSSLKCKVTDEISPTQIAMILAKERAREGKKKKVINVPPPTNIERR